MPFSITIQWKIKNMSAHCNCYSCIVLDNFSFIFNGNISRAYKSFFIINKSGKSRNMKRDRETKKKKQNGKCTHIWKTTQFIKQFLLLLFFWWSLFRNPNYDSYFNGLDRGSVRHEISCVKAKIEDNRYGFKKIL